MNKTYVDRLEKLYAEMNTNKVDCIIVTNSTNLFYMTGYSPKKCERLLCVIFPAGTSPILIVPSIHAMDSSKMCWINDQRVWKDGQALDTFIYNILQEKKLIGMSMAIDDTMEYMHCKYFFAASPSSKYTSASPLFFQN